MKFRFGFLLLLALLLAGSIPTLGAELPVLSVAHFNDTTGWYHFRDLGTAAREITTALLTQEPEIVVVDEIHLDSPIEADYLLTGSILSLDHKVTKFTGYDLNSEKHFLSISLTLALTNNHTGIVGYASLITEELEIPEYSESKLLSSTDLSKLLHKAISRGVKGVINHVCQLGEGQ